jgi:SagB-type dehydrogenase family enzyme
VYVAAERVSGLPSGLYYYGVQEHELARVRPGAFLTELGQALERPETIEGAAAAVLIGNVFRRYTWRYANRGYRYALIDSGHIGENLRLASFSAGLGELGPLRFEDDRLHRMLELDGREEAVCAVHLLGVAATASPQNRGPSRFFVERQEAEGAKFAAEGPAIERYHEATKLMPGNGKRVLQSRQARRRPLGSESGIPLSNLDPTPLLAVERAIAARRSAERFDPLPISLAKLGFVAEMAQGHEALRRAEGIDLLLACHRVDGLEPGLYRYAPHSHRLLALRAGDLRKSMTDACLGQEMADAAAVGFLMVGRLVEAVARGGERSYRDLLLEAGGIGQRIYLAAEAAGLVARNLAAFIDDELNALLGLDGRREAVLHLTLLGRGD